MQAVQARASARAVQPPVRGLWPIMTLKMSKSRLIGVVVRLTPLLRAAAGWLGPAARNPLT